MNLIKKYSSDKAGENQVAKSLSVNIKYPVGFEAYLTNNVLSTLAIYRVGEKRIFYSCCGKFETYGANRQRPRARELTTCPYCRRTCIAVPYTTTVRDNSGVLISWKDSKGDILYMALLDIWRKYEADWENLKFHGDLSVSVQPIAIYIASRERQEAFINYSYWGWKSENDTVRSLENPSYDIHIEPKSFKNSIPKSFLRYTEALKRVARMNCQGLVRYIFIAAKYPQVEYLEKMGLEDLIFDKVYSRRTYRAVNWGKSTPQEMLGLPKEALREVLKAMDKRDPAKMIATARRCYKEGWKIKAAELRDVSDLIDLIDDKEILKNTTIKKLYRYLVKQYEKNKPCCSHGAYGYSRGLVKHDYRDYISEAKEIGYDLESDYFRFPKDLPETHRISGEVLRKKRDAEEKAQKKKEAAELKQKMKNFKEKILCKLIAMEYTNGKLMITPAKCEEDLKEESRQLGHCVGGGSYWRNMVDGKSSIFFIRRKDEPEKSFYTLQLKDEEVVQCRGKSNCGMTEEVQKFVNKWHQEVVLGKKLKTKKQNKVA
jgi:hypothetical protein